MRYIVRSTEIEVSKVGPTRPVSVSESCSAPTPVQTSQTGTGCSVTSDPEVAQRGFNGVMSSLLSRTERQHVRYKFAMPSVCLPVSIVLCDIAGQPDIGEGYCLWPMDLNKTDITLVADGK